MTIDWMTSGLRALVVALGLGLHALAGAQPSTQAGELVDSARQAAAGAYREQPGETTKPLSAESDPRYARFRADLEAATIPRWTGVAKVTETMMPGTGERLYKFSNGPGSYCVRIPSPRVGIDRYEWERRNFNPMKCPR